MDGAVVGGGGEGGCRLTEDGRLHLSSLLRVGESRPTHHAFPFHPAAVPQLHTAIVRARQEVVPVGAHLHPTAMRRRRDTRQEVVPVGAHLHPTA